MSIRDKDGNEIIHLNSVWSASFKLLMIMVPFVAVTLFSWGTWVTITIFDHNTNIRILQDRGIRNAAKNHELPNATAFGKVEPAEAQPN